jgi:hypothetical protein
MNQLPAAWQGFGEACINAMRRDNVFQFSEEMTPVDPDADELRSSKVVPCSDTCIQAEAGG